jgi:hypothetical protein
VGEPYRIKDRSGLDGGGGSGAELLPWACLAGAGVLHLRGEPGPTAGSGEVVQRRRIALGSLERKAVPVAVFGPELFLEERIQLHGRSIGVFRVPDGELGFLLEAFVVEATVRKANNDILGNPLCRPGKPTCFRFIPVGVPRALVGVSSSINSVAGSF